MDDLKKMLEAQAAQREADAMRFERVEQNVCMVCRTEGPDKRNLIVSCLYDVREVAPEFIDLDGIKGELKGHGFYLRICKTCRAAFLSAVGAWFRARASLRGVHLGPDGEALDIDSEANIAVRINGAQVMMTRAQWDEHAAKRGFPGREPMIPKKDGE